MKMKLGAVLNLTEALQALTNVKAPIGLSLKLRALSRETDVLLADYESERIKLLKELAETNEAGELVMAPDETAIFASEANKTAFFEALADLRMQEVEIKTTIQPGNFGTAEVEPWIVLALGDILTDA